MAASLSGAVDLTGLKKRAEARRDATRPGAAAPGAAAAADGSGPVTAIDVDETGFEQDVLVRSTRVPVITEFCSRRAPSAMTGILTAMAEAAGGSWVHARIDVDRSLQLAEALQLRAVPTVLAMAGGRPIAEFEGEQPEEALRGWIEAVLRATEGKLAGPEPVDAGADGPGEPADPERDAAEDLLADGDLAGAEQAFAALAEQRPRDHSITEAWRQVQAMHRLEQASDSEPADPVSLAFVAADRSLVAGEYEQAFAGLVAAVRSTVGDERAAVRTRLLEALEILPTDDPRVLAARRDLASALY